MQCQGSHHGPQRGAQRGAWLRLVPEPERLLPHAVAALRTGTSTPVAAAVTAEQQRLDAVVLHAGSRAWLRVLGDALSLAGRTNDPALLPDALLVAEVVRDHHRLLIGLSRSLAFRSGRDRHRAEDLVRRLRLQVGAADGVSA